MCSPSRSGGIGRRAGFKILFWQQSVGSIPTSGSTESPRKHDRKRGFFLRYRGDVWGAVIPKITTPGGIRTHDLRFRKPMLYPAELLAHVQDSTGIAR
jgi:hypothetical protein